VNILKGYTMNDPFLLLEAAAMELYGLAVDKDMAIRNTYEDGPNEYVTAYNAVMDALEALGNGRY
jgi:hypothetical protein